LGPPIVRYSDEIVARARELRTNGVTLKAIVATLRAEAFVGPRGGRIHEPEVYRMVRDIATSRLRPGRPRTPVESEPRTPVQGEAYVAPVNTSRLRCALHKKELTAPSDCPDCAAGIVWPHDGKLSEFQAKAAFLRVFPHHGTISTTCVALSLKPQRVGGWVSRDKNFAAAFEEAKILTADILERTAYRLARDGYQRPVYQRGVCVGYEPVISPPVILAMLKALRPEKFREQRVVEHSGPDGGPIQVEAVRERLVGRILSLASGDRDSEEDRESDASGNGDAGVRLADVGQDESA
jgi:hypothetical protein